MVVAQLPGYSNVQNPYNGLLCDALVSAGAVVVDQTIRRAIGNPKLDVVHVHWPEYWLNLAPETAARKHFLQMMAGLRIARLRGAKLFWTAHNLKPHEDRYPEKREAFYSRWIAMVDGIICLSESAREQMYAAFPATRQKKTFVIPHGDYCTKIRGLDRSEARRELKLPEDSAIVGNFGVVRPYKNVPHLVKMFRTVAGEKDLLLIAGKCADAALAAEIRAAAGDDPRVRLDLEFLPDELLETYSSSCDVIALPYRNILNSGSALYGLSVGRPIVAPAVGSLPELQADVGAEWMMLYPGEFGECEMRATLELARSPRAGKPNLDKYHWSAIGEQTLAAYRSV